MPATGVPYWNMGREHGNFCELRRLNPNEGGAWEIMGSVATSVIEDLVRAMNALERKRARAAEARESVVTITAREPSVSEQHPELPDTAMEWLFRSAVSPSEHLAAELLCAQEYRAPQGTGVPARPSVTGIPVFDDMEAGESR